MTVLIKKGAEASLYLEKWHNREVIFKRRHPKRYRNQALDREIRFKRTLHEPNFIHIAKEAGVPTPTVYMVDLKDATIVMEHVKGKEVKQILDGLSGKERLLLSRQIGNLIGRLHKHGIIHGDLTTSNIILTSNNKTFLIDFGLSERSMELENRGVDLHLMKRAFHSTHYKYAKSCFESVVKGYAEIMGADEASNVLEKIREIEKRGRYVSER